MMMTKNPQVATIGFFDGVHRGHRYLIDQMITVAKEANMESSLITFDRHPRQVLHSDYLPQMLSTFEEKKALAKLATEKLSDEGNTGIQVYIGEEAPVQAMKDCSVVTATYELGEGMRGSIAIIGPKRMDYDKVVGSLRTMMNELERVYKKD